MKKLHFQETSIKLGIFYHKNEKPENRRYWIGTFTPDGTGCQDVMRYVPGKGKDALKQAKLTLNNY